MKKTQWFVAAVLAVSMIGCGGGSKTTVPTPEGAVTVDNKANEVTITNEETGEKMTSGTAVPADFPPAFVYPNHVKVLSSVTISEGSSIVTFATNDSPEKIIAFYKNAVTTAGYTIEATTTMNAMQILSAQKGPEAIGVHVMALEGHPDAKTSIQVMIGKN